MRPQTARAAYGFALLIAVAAAFVPTTVSTRNGEVPFFIVMPALAAFAGLRLMGIHLQIGAGRARMAWGWRAASWLALAALLFVLGLFVNVVGFVAVAVFALADSAGAAAAPETERPETRREPALARWAWAKAPVVATCAAATVPAFHFLVARYFPFAYLLDWTYACLLAVAALRLLAGRGDRLSWEAVQAPRHHRLHRRVERRVPDPMRNRMQSAVDGFLKAGDAGRLLEAAREAAALARLAPEDVERMEREVLAALARAGTSREEDLREALRVLEESLTASHQRTVIPA